MDMQSLKKEARREYMREWRKKNPEKLRAAQERYWTRKAAEIAAKREKPPISGDSNEGTTNGHLNKKGRLQRLFRVPQRGQQPNPPGFLNLHCVAISKTRYFKPNTASAAMNYLKQLAPKPKALCRPQSNG